MLHLEIERACGSAYTAAEKADAYARVGERLQNPRRFFQDLYDCVIVYQLAGDALLFALTQLRTSFERSFEQAVSQGAGGDARLSPGSLSSPASPVFAGWRARGGPGGPGGAGGEDLARMVHQLFVVYFVICDRGLAAWGDTQLSAAARTLSAGLAADPHRFPVHLFSFFRLFSGVGVCGVFSGAYERLSRGAALGPPGASPAGLRRGGVGGTSPLASPVSSRAPGAGRFGGSRFGGAGGGADGTRPSEGPGRLRTFGPVAPIDSVDSLDSLDALAPLDSPGPPDGPGDPAGPDAGPDEVSDNAQEMLSVFRASSAVGEALRIQDRHFTFLLREAIRELGGGSSIPARVALSFHADLLLGVVSEAVGAYCGAHCGAAGQGPPGPAQPQVYSDLLDAARSLLLVSKAVQVQIPRSLRQRYQRRFMAEAGRGGGPASGLGASPGDPRPARGGSRLVESPLCQASGEEAGGRSPAPAASPVSHQPLASPSALSAPSAPSAPAGAPGRVSGRAPVESVFHCCSAIVRGVLALLAPGGLPFLRQLTGAAQADREAEAFLRCYGRHGVGRAGLETLTALFSADSADSSRHPDPRDAESALFVLEVGCCAWRYIDAFCAHVTHHDTAIFASTARLALQGLGVAVERCGAVISVCRRFGGAGAAGAADVLQAGTTGAPVAPANLLLVSWRYSVCEFRFSGPASVVGASMGEMGPGIDPLLNPVLDSELNPAVSASPAPDAPRLPPERMFSQRAALRFCPALLAFLLERPSQHLSRLVLLPSPAGAEDYLDQLFAEEAARDVVFRLLLTLPGSTGQAIAKWATDQRQAAMDDIYGAPDIRIFTRFVSDALTSAEDVFLGLFFSAVSTAFTGFSRAFSLGYTEFLPAFLELDGVLEVLTVAWGGLLPGRGSAPGRDQPDESFQIQLSQGSDFLFPGALSSPSAARGVPAGPGSSAGSDGAGIEGLSHRGLESNPDSLPSDFSPDTCFTEAHACAVLEYVLKAGEAMSEFLGAGQRDRSPATPREAPPGAGPDLLRATRSFCAVLFFRRACLFVSAVAGSAIFPLRYAENVINLLCFLLADQAENPGLQILAAEAMRSVLQALQGTGQRGELASCAAFPASIAAPFALLTTTPPEDHLLAVSLLRLCESALGLLPLFGSLLPAVFRVPEGGAQTPPGPEDAGSFPVGPAIRSVIGFAACLGPASTQEFQAATGALAALVGYLRYLFAHGHLSCVRGEGEFTGEFACEFGGGLASGTATEPGGAFPAAQGLSPFGVFATDGALFVCGSLLPRAEAAGAQCVSLAAECAQYLADAGVAAALRPEEYSAAVRAVLRALGRSLRSPGAGPGRGDGGRERRGREAREEACDIGFLAGFVSALGPRALAAQDVLAELVYSLCSQETIEDCAGLTYCALGVLLDMQTAGASSGTPRTCQAPGGGKIESGIPRGPSASRALRYVLSAADPFHRALAGAALPELPSLPDLMGLSGDFFQFLVDMAMFYLAYLSEYRGQAFSSLLALFRPALLLFSAAAAEQGLQPLAGRRPVALHLESDAAAGAGAGDLSGPLLASTGRQRPAGRPEGGGATSASPRAGVPPALLSWARECTLAAQPVAGEDSGRDFGRAMAWLSWACGGAGSSPPE